MKKLLLYSIFISIALSLGACGGSGGSGSGSDQSVTPRHGKNFTWQNPSPPSVYYFGSETFANVSYAVGEWGTIIRTSDAGSSWQDINSGTRETLRDIASNGSAYVVVGTTGTILYSDDGTNWSIKNSQTSENLLTVFWDGSKFIAAGTDAVFLTSVDGVNWKRRDVKGAPYYTAFSDIVLGNGTYVMSTYAGRIFTSLDGLTWEKQTSGIEDLSINDYAVGINSLVWNGSHFVAVGTQGVVIHSSDGINWTRTSLPTFEDLHDTGIANGEVIAVGRNGTVVTSGNLTDWTVLSTDAGNMRTLTVTNNISVIFPKIITLSDRGIVSTTYDRTTWNIDKTSENGPLLYDAAWNGSVYVTVGHTILYSTDGENWNQANASFCCLLHEVIWANNQFIVVGYFGEVLTSADGINWISRNSQTTEGLESITWNGALYLAAGLNGVVVTSPDGINWSLQTSGYAGEIRKVIWNGTRFVAIGSDFRTQGTLLFPDTTVLTSDDGSSWQLQMFTDEKANGMVWTGTEFYAVGDNGFAITSTDGLNWEGMNIPHFVSYEKIDWVNGKFIIRPYVINFNEPNLFVGSDLGNLTGYRMPDEIYDSIYDGHNIYSFGDDANIFKFLDL